MLMDDVICLEPLSERHVGPRYLAWVNDPETTRYLESGGKCWGESDLESYIRNLYHEGQHPFAILDRASGEHIGNVKLGKINADGSVDIGILLGQVNARGQGLASRAYKLCLRYAFERLGVEEVFAGAYRENPASIRLHRRMGFSECEGAVEEAVGFIMRKGEYERRRDDGMRIVALVQARMSSTRLPGKVLADICGKPCLQRVCERAKASLYVDELIVATSTNGADDAVCDLAMSLGYTISRGPEEDVLQRALDALGRFQDNDIVVRVTADCPCYDSSLLDDALSGFQAGSDYLADFEHRLPDGLDIEAFSIGALRKSVPYATRQSDREHFTQAIRRHGDEFNLQDYEPPFGNAGNIRVTLDGPSDLEVIRDLYARFGDTLSHRDIIDAALTDERLLEAKSPHSRDVGLRRQLALEERLQDGKCDHD